MPDTIVEAFLTPSECKLDIDQCENFKDIMDELGIPYIIVDFETEEDIVENDYGTVCFAFEKRYLTTEQALLWAWTLHEFHPDEYTMYETPTHYVFRLWWD